MITLENPPPDELRMAWAKWFFKVFKILSGLHVPVFTDATRGSAGNTGRVIFNSDDGMLNIDSGSDWTLPDGTVT